MNTDPPAPAADLEKPKPSMPPRPRGKVFDVMRPGKAATPPMTRPVVVGHKPLAEASQMKVSGIGEAPAQQASEHNADTGMAEKFPPRRYIATADAAPEAVQATAVGNLIGAAADKHDSAPAEPELPASEQTPEPTSEKPSKKQKKYDDHFDESNMPPDVPPEKLDEAAMDPEPPAPAPAEPEPRVPHPASDPLADVPVHEAGPPNLGGQVVVSHHTTAPSGAGKMAFLIIVMVLLALTVVDLLMDVGLLSIPGVPHTHLF